MHNVFLRQTDEFFSPGVMTGQTFYQLSDDINTKDDITPFDGTLFNFWSLKPWIRIGSGSGLVFSLKSWIRIRMK